MRARFKYVRRIWDLWNIFILVSEENKSIRWIEFKKIKLEKLGVSRARIDEAKESSNLGQSSWWLNWFNN